MADSPDPLEQALHTICRENFALRPGELLLVAADPPCLVLGKRLVESARKIGQPGELLEIGLVEAPGKAPEGFTAEALSRGAATLLVSSKSLSHTGQRREACREKGARIASMPGVTEEMLARLFSPGSAELVERSTRVLAGRLAGADKITLKCPGGTDLVLSVRERRLYLDNGLYREPGRFGNLPAGEVSWAPVEGSASGRIVVDVAFAGLGETKGLALEIENSVIARASGPGSGRLLEMLSGPAERVLGEFGIGTNPLARPGAVTLEAEKAVGTVHFGFGDNRSFGGENVAAGHWDAVVHCDTLELDGEKLELGTAGNY